MTRIYLNCTLLWFYIKPQWYQVIPQLGLLWSMKHFWWHESYSCECRKKTNPEGVSFFWLWRPWCQYSPAMKPESIQQTEEIQQSNADPKEFFSTVIRIAVSQICKSVGFKAVQISAIELLTDLAIRHLWSIGRSAVSFANASNRTEPNIFDLVNALNDLNLATGFTGACNLHKDDCPVLSSSTVSSLIHFVECSPEIPFARPIRPLSSGNSSLSAVLNNASVMEFRTGLEHVARWLPEFPDSSSFKESRGELDRMKKRKYELWGDLVSSGAANGCSTICSVKRKVQTHNGKQIGKVKLTISGAKKGLNGIAKEVLMNGAIDEETESTSNRVILQAFLNRKH